MIHLVAMDGMLRRTIQFLIHEDGEEVLQAHIQGIQGARGPEVVNAIPTSTEKTELLHAWKRKIAREVRAAVGQAVGLRSAAISVSFFFCPATHGNRALDADNFLKPVIDGVALGLFHRDLEAVLVAPKTRFDADSSVFRWMYLERHDTTNPDEEGVVVTVWSAE